MRRTVAAALMWAIVVAVPAIVVGNALWVLLNPWLADVQYALPGFPDDPYGLDREQRSELAAIGIRSIRPFGDGVQLLRDARLPNGMPAFQAREVRHMADVRDLVTGFTVAWAVGLALAIAGAAALLRLEGPRAVRAAFARGALATLVAIAVLAVFMAVAFGAFFTSFHGIFFEGDSWRFSDTATLRRLYPDSFWAIAGAAMAALVAAQAAVVGLALRRGRRSDRA